MRIIIEQDVNIYRYPTDFESSLGSITLGDLHGNAVKLIYFLIRHKIIRFKDGINAEQSYANFVVLYETLAELRDQIKTNQSIDKLNARLVTYFTSKITRCSQLDEDLHKSIDEELEYGRLFQDLGRYRDARELHAKQLADVRAESSDLKAQLLIQLADFERFMAQLEVQDKNSLVRLIGDELADRGSNDYLTLQILVFLRNEGVNVSTIISNHGMEFITACESLALYQCFKAKEVLSDEYKMSFVGLTLLLNEGLVTKDELSALVDHAYKPTLKMIDYDLNNTQDEISLFTHAPIAFAVIKTIATYLKCVYDDSTATALASTIDAINNELTQHVMANRLHKLYDSDIGGFDNMSLGQINRYPFIYFIWNRWDAAKNTVNARPSCHNGYKINYIHGHDSYESECSHVCGLDTLCGKEARRSTAKIQSDGSVSYAIDGIYDDVSETYKVWNSDEYYPKQSTESLLSELEFRLQHWNMSGEYRNSNLGLFSRQPNNSVVSADISSAQPCYGQWHSQLIITQHVALNSQPTNEVCYEGASLSEALESLDDDYYPLKQGLN